jgi:hypothetical protein
MVSPSMARSGMCFDSVHIRVDPVQCASFRNGLITIDSVFGGQAPYFYSIDNQTFSTRAEFDRLWPGGYQLTIRDANGCSEMFAVEVPEPDELRVELRSSKPTVRRGEPFSLEAEVQPATALIAQYEWRPPAQFSVHDTRRQTNVRISETTTFAIEVVDQNGCTARAQAVVEVSLPELYFPNAILLGSNQSAYFTIFAGDGVDQISLLQVWSREGTKVFERKNFPPNDPLLGWGGQADGKRMQPGVFTWTAVIRLLDGSEEEFSGDLNVIR